MKKRLFALLMALVLDRGAELGAAGAGLGEGQ